MTEVLLSAQSRLDTDWWRQAVVYQVYPRSFADSDADGVGDLAGITSRIGYLAELGVDAIWLSPFYPSPLADGGYDVSDYRDVHPQLGTLSDFDDLVAAAHASGLKIIVDLVPNHTSDQHPWFVEALASPPGSPARDRYIFRDGTGPDGSQPPSDWPSHFGGSAWTQAPDGSIDDGERSESRGGSAATPSRCGEQGSDHQPLRRAGQFYLHLFAPEQPDLNWDNAEVRADFRRTIRFWSNRGVDGFRVDVAHALAKDLSEPLPSKLDLYENVPLDGTDPLFDRNEVHEIYAEWRQVFDSYDPPRMAVAESCAPPERRALYARPTSLGQAFNFSLLEAPFDATTFQKVITFCLNEAAKAGSSSTWVLSNHDVVRHASRYAVPVGTDLEAWLMSGGTLPSADEATGLRRARAATLLLLALPGSTYLYQGEELGLHEVADLPDAALQDPIWHRTANTKKGRDGCRVPLPWVHAGDSYGFGDAAAWLPQPAGFSRTAVAAQRGRADSTWSSTGRRCDCGEPADRRGAHLAPAWSLRGAAVRPPGGLALRDQLPDRARTPARRRGAGQQCSGGRRPAARRGHRLAHGVANALSGAGTKDLVAAPVHHQRRAADALARSARSAAAPPGRGGDVTALKERQQSSALAGSGEFHGRVNLLNWDGKVRPPKLFPEQKS